MCFQVVLAYEVLCYVSVQVSILIFYFKNNMFQALVVPDRYPAGLSASLHRLGFMLWLRWLGSQAKHSLIVLFLLGSLPFAGYQSGLHYSRDVRECNLV